MEIRLQSVLLPTEGICEEQELYYHTLDEGRSEDYDGYFNLFYIEKRKRYTGLAGLRLNLRLQGYVSITLMHDRDEIMSYELGYPYELRDYSFDYPYEGYKDGVFWFRLVRSGVAGDTGVAGGEKRADDGHDTDSTGGGVQTSVAGEYVGIVDETRPVRVLVDICTYRRETYVLENMRRLTGYLSDERNRYIRDNIIVSLIDNGRTLNEIPEITGITDENPYIRVIENHNTGGSGGFTRGMEEAITLREREGLTHVLLMDDDATFEPDLYVRLYGLLATLRDEYADITVGGAIWRDDYPYIQHASGEWYERLSLRNTMPFLDMRSYEECTQEEMCSTAYEYRRYSGWWCCCYSLNTVRMDNLPMQFFVHGDDIEYEKRNRLNGNPVVFINGIGVWHRAFDSEFKGNKEYYDFRNFLILTAIHEPDLPKSYIRHKIGRMLLDRCFARQYAGMEWAYMGAMDYLKGPAWFETIDPEAHHQIVRQYMADQYRFVPLHDVEVSNMDELLARAEQIGNGVQVSKLTGAGRARPGAVSAFIRCVRDGLGRPHKPGAAISTPDESFWEMDFRYRETCFYIPRERKAMVVRVRPGAVWRVMRMYVSFARGLAQADISEWSRAYKLDRADNFSDSSATCF
ncbi:MAG: glycosyltransferase family 2 protein [Lachnospiraceae bacterium]|nr:glycosyltransferase family 2 protein [Lachnospiraceae bacterium]